MLQKGKMEILKKFFIFPNSLIHNDLSLLRVFRAFRGKYFFRMDRAHSRLYMRLLPKVWRGMQRHVNVISLCITSIYINFMLDGIM
jgi:hypothetical protein